MARAVGFAMTRRTFRALALRGPASGALAALAVAALLAGCDDRVQTPKVAGLHIIGLAAAQQSDRVVPPAAVAGVMAPIDEAFALFIASSSLAEIEGARLVLKSSKNTDVLDFAQKLLRDHTRIGDELKRIVGPRGVKLPPAPTGRHADMVTKLAGVAVSERDDAFVQRFGIDAHKEVVTERHMTEGKDAQLRRYAEQALAMLREHVSAAHKLAYAAAGR
jgi:putative membrane protein